MLRDACQIFNGTYVPVPRSAGANDDEMVIRADPRASSGLANRRQLRVRTDLCASATDSCTCEREHTRRQHAHRSHHPASVHGHRRMAARVWFVRV